MPSLSFPYSPMPGSAIQSPASFNAWATEFPPGIQNVLNQEHLPDTAPHDRNFRITTLGLHTVVANFCIFVIIFLKRLGRPNRAVEYFKYS